MTTPLAEVVRAAALPRAPLEDLIAARRADAYREPPQDEAALWTYLEATGGGLLRLAVQALGGAGEVLTAGHTAGSAFGAAGLLAAQAELDARGRPPLPSGADPAAVARQALARLADARATPVPPHLRAAFRSGWLARPILESVLRSPGTPPAQPAEITKRLRLMLLTGLNRW